MSDMTATHATADSRVQQELGRALVRFQELERKIKLTVLPRWVVSDPASVSVGFEARRAEVMKAPLGWLKEELLGKYIYPEGSDPGDSELQKAERRQQFGMLLRIGIPPEEYARLSDDFSCLHQRRNRLVHHFVEDFQLSDPTNCAQALEWLIALHAELDERLSRVESFIEWMAEVHAYLVRQLVERLPLPYPVPDGDQNPDSRR